MAVKVFITGATGYIGGDVLFAVVEKHPDWDITCLVRNSDKGAKIGAQYAHIRLVYGDLDSIDQIEEEASKADIVYHFANCDHEPSANAISRGLARRKNGNPGFWIHTSGSQVLALETIENNLYGEQTSKVFNDWDGVGELISIPHQAPHRNVDEIVLDASATHSDINTAIVCPPTIYGVGRGPDNQRSMQIYWATEYFLKQQKACQIGNGRNVWHQVHIHDLTQIYLSLGEAAAAGGAPASWNEQGYYLAENGEFVWGEILQDVAREAYKKGLLPSDRIENMSPSDIGMRFARGIGTNSRGTSMRARQLLSWNPKERSLKEEIPTIVESEAKALGLVKSHAEKIEEQST